MLHSLPTINYSLPVPCGIDLQLPNRWFGGFWGFDERDGFRFFLVIRL
jgi:hypothetical protein